MATPTQPAEVLQHGADACERVAKALDGVAAAARAIVNGPLELRSVAILIRAQLPRGSKLEVAEIMDVLRAAEAMGRFHLKAPKAVR